MPKSKHRKLPRSRRRAPQGAGRRCGLCGKTGKLTRTECCGNWICDDADEYVIFSYARNSCYRNHDRFTLCGYHHTEGHAGRCATCGAAIRLADGGYSQCGRDYWCQSCSRNALETREPRPVTPLPGRRRGHPAKD